MRLLAAPLNTTDIILLGGQSDRESRIVTRDAFKFNVESNEISQILDNDFGFQS